MSNSDDIQGADLPGLFDAADHAARTAQRTYFNALRWYLITLVLAAVVSYASTGTTAGALLSAALFLLSLGILIFMRARRPDDTWYNGRAVAESVKTRAWRWMMRADPYEGAGNVETMRKEFISDLKDILDQNRRLAAALATATIPAHIITPSMASVRALPVAERLAVYRSQRVDEQGAWYAQKAEFNKRRASQWFIASVVIHAAAIIMLLLRITDASLRFPTAPVASLAGAALTWLQARKHNELSSSYALAAYEIVLIKSEAESVATEADLAEYVINAEAAFSREHTQWSARKKGD